MLARSTVARGIPRCCAPSARRGMAAVASTNPFHYSVGDAAGVKVASRDDGGPTTSLSVVVRGGSRYQPAPGVAHGLSRFSFKSTTRRSALRLQREAELLGGSFVSSLSRENIVVGAKFLRGDLPYFVEALGEVLSKTKYVPYEFNEDVAPAMAGDITNHARDPSAVALEHAHHVAFHSGLGGHRLAVSSKFPHNLIPSYAQQVYQKGNIAVVASGAPHADLLRWAGEFFADVNGGSGVSSRPTEYFGGENRTYSAAGDALVIAFPGSPGGPGFKAESSVLAHLLGGEGATKWNAGTSVLSQAVGQITGVKAVARHTAYSDAGLLTISITGPQPSLTQAGQQVVKAINSLSSPKPDELKRAIAQAKFDVLAAAEDRSAGLELVGQSVIASAKAPQVEDAVKALGAVTAASLKKAVGELLAARATYTVVGDLHYLPFASDIGLKA